MVIGKREHPVSAAASSLRLFRLSIALALALVITAATAGGARAAGTPTPGAPYFNGPSNRYTLGGVWYVQRDGTNQGLRRGFPRSTSFPAANGWSATSVPYSFNADDYSENSYNGSIAWYATEFKRPKAPRGANWTLRFDSVNYEARVWLNGREIGRHKGGYVPFELRATAIKPGVNRLVVRVDSRLHENSVPSQEMRNDQLTGGWWNFGGILREVILRRSQAVDIAEVTTRAKFKRTRGPAKITVLARVRNQGRRKLRLRLRGRFGGSPVRFKRTLLRRGAGAEIVGTATIRRPRLWQPLSPKLYKVTVGGGGANYRLKAGIRRLFVSKSGSLSVNGRRVQLRGVSYHEIDDAVGAAWTPAIRGANLALITRLGATAVRSHYPLSPATMEWADRNGIFVWVQAPVYRARETQLKSKRYRSNAIEFTRQMVLANRQHPSVLVWSLMNEAVPAGTTYINKVISAQKSVVSKLDPDGLVGADYAAAPEDELQHPAYRKLDVLGVNEYFGWYPGLLGSTLDVAKLAPYLEYLHRTYSHQALFVTEFGAEANRGGSADEPGTYEFQANFMITHMRILRSVPFLNGYFAWALKDYAVRPDWTGGNPDPSPPYSKKGLFDLAGGPKPAAAEVEREFKATPPFK